MNPPTIRPSSMPALAKCPCFASGGDDSEFTGPGTERHTAFQKSLEGDDSYVDALQPEERDGVRWAVEYVRTKANLENYPLECEKRVTFVGPDFSEYSGTSDVVCGPDVFDLKWRHCSSYAEQMAAYACANPHERVRVHVLFAETQRAVVYDTADGWEPYDTVARIIERVQSPDAAPSPCDYCGWCANRPTCPALIDGVNAVVAGRPEWGLPTYHASELATADDIGRALTIARRLKEWVASVEWRSEKAAFREGMTPTGFTVRSKSGRARITDISMAYALSGLTADEFFQCADVRMSKPNKFPELTGLVDVYAAKHNLPISTARRDVKRKLASVMVQAPSSQSLVAVSGPDDQSEE